MRVDLVKFNSIKHWSYFSKDSHRSDHHSFNLLILQEVLMFCPHSSQIFYHSKKPSNQNKWRDKTKYQSEKL